MDENQMLEICDADQASRLALAARMQPLYNGRPAAWLGEAVKAGRSQVLEIRRGGKAIGAFWCYLSRLNNTLVVNAAGSLARELDISSDLFYAIECTAKIQGATAVQFQTARRGLVAKARSRGYVAEGVVLSKPL